MTALEDVEDVEAFVRWLVGRTLVAKGKVGPSEIEEACGEGLVLLYEIHDSWDPARCPRFSAFALELLPRRMISWWRRDLRESGQGSYSGSKNTYTYRTLLSYEVMAEDNDNRLITYAPE